jgi:NAD-dependent SIR2 family protein deacetylase
MYNLKKNLENAKSKLKNADAILVLTGAGMSVDSGIPTYRGNNGLWEKEIRINNKMYSYDEISSLKMWKEFPKLAWGFKSNFIRLINSKKPHSGYNNLLKNLKNKFQNNYFICTSNIDGYFLNSGFDKNKIYELHGSVRYLQCFDKKCNIRNGVWNIDKIPAFDEKTLIAKELLKCPYCGHLARPNVSMFGDFDFYGIPYEHQKRRLSKWLNDNKNKKILIIEIGCGINPHSIRMNNGKMMSGEWKIPQISNILATIRINPSDIEEHKDTIHIALGAKNGIQRLFN